MTTKIWGESDDLVEINGDVTGEVCAPRADQEPVLLVFDDGTQLAVGYGKPGNGGVWRIDVIKKGLLFDSIAVCDDENASPYSDVVTLKDGATKALWAKEWGVVE